jgi:hypothetical protein
MSNITPKDARFIEILSGLFMDLLRHGGITMTDSKKIEAVRTASDALGAAIESAAERKAVEIGQRIQEAIVAAFTAFEKDVEELTARIDTLEGKNEDPTNGTD